MTTLLGALMLVSAAGFNDTLETFPIGFWNYAPTEVFDEAKIQEWQDAGVTLTMGPEFKATPENIAHMRRILDWAGARGIKVIVCDPRTRARTPLPPDYADQVANAVEDFGRHDVAFGFHILDEPGTAQFEPVCDATRVTKAAAAVAYPIQILGKGAQ